MLILNDIRNVKRMALIATKCPACGKVKVFMAGVLVKVISLQAATEKNNKAIPFGNFSPKKDGSAKIVVTTQGRPVIIEGLGISKL